MKQSAIAVAVGLAFAVQGEWAHALPEGGQVSAGQGTIGTPSNGALVVHQQSSRLAIDWLRFGIGAGESVHFAQPGASAIALNRVLGTDPSRIYGSLSATGQVFLLNPNGVLFAPGSQVNVGGLVASTLGLSNEDFLAGRYVFSKGEKAGAVVNQGEITAGYAALLGPQVSNEGIITATLGSVALAAGEQITLNLNGTSLVGLSVDKGALDALAANKHLIRADGGTVILTARATDEILRNVVNNDGIIEARTLSERNGVIRLESSGSGIAAVDGTLEAHEITVTGDKVGLFDHARLDAPGGTILVGGSFQGKGPERNSSITYVAPGARLSADAAGEGDGGKVIVWSDGTTRFYGRLSARGGAQGGDGGFAEISGKEVLSYNGSVDLAAPNGHAGRVLFDPKNFTVANGGASVLAANDAFAENAALTATVDADQITAITNTGVAVTVQANNDVAINEAIASDNSTGNGGAITFQAGRSILINASITTDNGNLTLIANERAASGVDTANRDAGAAVITMAASTALNAGSGTMTINMRDGAGRTGGKETSGDITLRQISAGTLNVIQGGATAGSDIVQAADVITVSGTSSFTSTGDITVTGTNDFQDTVSIEGMRVRLSDNVDLLKLAPASVGEVEINARELHLSGTYSTLEGQPFGMGAQIYNAQLTRLTGNTTLSAPSNVQLNNGAVVGPGSLTINHTNAGSVSIASSLGLAPGEPNPVGGGAIGASGPLGGLSVNTTDSFFFPSSSYVGGNVSVSSTGSIQQGGGPITVTGTSSFSAAGDIHLISSNDFQDTVSIEGMRVRLSDNVDLLKLAPASVGEIEINARELHLSGTYSTLEGQPFGMGAQIYNAQLTRLTGNTTLSAPSNVQLNNGAVVGPGSLTINHTNAGSVSIASSLGLAPGEPNPVGGGAIGASGPLGGLSVNTTDSFFFPSSSYVGGNVSVSSTGSIQQGGGPITVTGTSSFSAAGDIHLISSNDFQDTVSIEGMRVRLSDNVDLLKLAPASVGEIEINARELHLSGTYSTLEGQPFGMGAQIYNAQLTRLTGNTTLSAPSNVQLNNGAVVGPGSLTINHTNAGSVSIASSLGLAPGEPNPVGGGAIGASGPLGGLSVNTTDSFFFPSSSYVGGNVSVSSTGSIQQGGGPITVTGTSSFSAAGDIHLISSNDFQDTVSIEGMRVRLSDNVDLLKLAPASVGEIEINARELHLSGTYSTLEGQPFGMGAQIYNAQLTRLTGNTTLSAPSNVQFNNGAVVGPGSLTINHTNAGSVSIASSLGLAPGEPNPVGGGPIGGSGPLGGLSVATVSSLSLPDAFASGAILAEATGNLTLPSGTTLRSNATGNAITLSTSGNFINSAGSGALSTPFGRWLVYSTSPAASTEGGLTAFAGATTPRLYNRTFGAHPPSSITEPGNHLVYSFAPSVTVTANAASRGYGAGNPVFTFATGALLTDDGVTDSTAAFTGSLVTAAVPASPVSSSPFAITQGSLASGAGYGITYTPANLTITPAPLTITADNYSKVENAPNPVFTATFTGFVLGESSPNLQGALVFNTPATTTSAPGAYAITPSGNTSGNYAITYVDGSLTVTGVAPVVATTASPAAGVTVEVGQAYFDALAAVKAAERAAPPSAPQALGRSELYVIENGGVRLPEGLQ